MQRALEVQDLAEEGSKSDDTKANTGAPEDATKSLYDLCTKQLIIVG
jgi:hypothetical protein